MVGRMNNSRQLCDDMLLHASDQIDAIVTRSLIALSGMVSDADLIELRMKIVITQEYALIGTMMAGCVDEAAGRALVDLYISKLPVFVAEGKERAIAMGLDARARAEAGA